MLTKLALAWAVLHGYLWWRFVKRPAWSPWVTHGLTALLVALFVLQSLTVWRGVAPVPALTPVGFFWMGLSFLLFWTAALAHAVELVTAAVQRARRAEPDAGRRNTLTQLLGGGAAALGLGAAVVGSAEARHLLVQRFPVSLRRLPPGLDGLRIVQISDLHVGRNIHRDYVAAIVERANALAPDLVVITGDLVDGSVRVLRDQVAPIADLRAPRGVFFVTGNHEYYSGAVEWVAHLATLGVRVLRNERVPIEGPDGGFDLAGVDDRNAAHYDIGHGCDPEGALAGRDPAREVVLLAHQPKTLADAVRLDVGLQLSGHTHGGQIFPLRFFLFDQPFVDGLHAVGATQIYVNRGAGFWGPPMRLGAPPEIAEITLRRG